MCWGEKASTCWSLLLTSLTRTDLFFSETSRKAKAGMLLRELPSNTSVDHSLLGLEWKQHCRCFCCVFKSHRSTVGLSRVSTFLFLCTCTLHRGSVQATFVLDTCWFHLGHCWAPQSRKCCGKGKGTDRPAWALYPPPEPQETSWEETVFFI